MVTGYYIKNVLLILDVSINFNGRHVQTFILEKFEEEKNCEINKSIVKLVCSRQ